jgi:predicted amidophosphoribosyltransferase
MNIVNCKGCGRLFNALSSETMCPECLRKIEDKFQDVKQYLEEHPDASMNEISEDCEVSIKQLKQWVREERLTFSANSVEGIECEQCGKLIKTGRFCDACKAKISNNLMSAIDRPKIKEAPVVKRDHENKMRFL